MTSPRRIIPIQAAPARASGGSLFETHKKVHVRPTPGVFTNWRWVMVCVTQLVFYGVPWLNWHGRQAVLFDLNARHFYIGGMVLLPQDFIYLAALLVLSALALFFFTAVAGRLWCGYACPQTVYSEIFIWIEQRLEGNRVARMRLERAPWSLDKLARKGSKHALWLGFSLWTGFTFVGYFTPIRALLASAGGLAMGPWETFWILFYGMATYGNAGYMREQVCKYMCPYARFQGVMLDADSLIVGYDERRGETRGSRTKAADKTALGLGDCIDCTMCVQVCPVGIDIRHGFQMECIGCGACIDACDIVMDKMQYPRGLIRYTTQNGLEQAWPREQLIRRVWRPRTMVYGGALLLGAGALVGSLMQRMPFHVDVIRDRGVMARLADDGSVENVYRLHIMNGTESQQRYQIGVTGLHGLYGLRVEDVPTVSLGSSEDRDVTVRVRLEAHVAASQTARVIPIALSVEQLGPYGQTVRVQEQSTFMMPR
jgi:cytochrome c oxidase accessory protein FixG